jgi:hypothetical protein
MQELLSVWLQEIMAKRELFLVLLLLASALSWGCIDSPGDGVKVITVGASDFSHVAEFSGSGPTRDGRTKPTIVAPGVDVISTVPPGLERLEYVDPYYARQSGTSLSTPVAAGMAALLLQADPSLTPAGVKAAMTRGARKLNNTLGERYEQYYQGAGCLDAYQSYKLLGQDLCGVEPEVWIAGRWAFLSGGKAISPGLDIGADRPIKKLYALAPSDQDWTTKFVFFTDTARENLSMRASGPISAWTILQPLPAHIPANGQEVFGATMTVPEGTAPGQYSGSIEIAEGRRIVLSIPVAVRVARPLKIERGLGRSEGALQRNGWDYYYLDVPRGTKGLKARLGWKGDSRLDLFLLAPTSEYYRGEEAGRTERSELTDPPSGRWLVAIHARELSAPENYTLEVERSWIESSPKRWEVGSLAPGQTRVARFSLENRGPSLENVSYAGMLENNSTRSFSGAVERGKILVKEIDVLEGVRWLEANLSWKGETSDLALRLYRPSGDLASSSDTYETREEVGAASPEPGRWRLEVEGVSLPPDSDQPFNLDLITYSLERWPWLSLQGPGTLQGGANGTLEASLSVPATARGREERGQIEIRSGNESFQIPVRLIVSGASLRGFGSSEVEDKDKDGHFDRLYITVDVNASIPGSYRVEGGLVDCSGRMIEWLKSTKSLIGSGDMRFEVEGGELWKKGGCGPLRMQTLFLYNQFGELIDQLQGNMTIDKSPEEFQPPAAYFTGSFQDQSTSSKIRIGVEVMVIKPGTYQVLGRLVDDEGDVMGERSVTSSLKAGNATVVLEFNPTKFMMMGRSSRLHIKSLVLSIDGVEVDRLDDAWSTKTYAPGDFKGGSGGSIRMEGGRAVIS